MEDKKIEKWTLEDGRRAERWTFEKDGERVVEVHMEAERPLILQHRVVEKSKPMVYEREIAVMDKDGNVVDKKIESMEVPSFQMINPNIKKELVDEIVAALNVHGTTELNSLGLADEIAANNTSEEMPLFDKVAIGAIVLLSVGLAYLVLVM